ncbi:Transcriptional regulatory protein, C terminal [Parafrankia irregularis]|uniref:Transcriptional regulatory protein, C terminal n=1 Tax=Parafrankia irregularis TaxID=795642 RepID=A0A0S4QSD1_9ACTN|nr:AfsR/SARP family transcriptional regulator [Parafrankia irregularis]MBE3205858.1 AAA family ATPase [Parafrankia sp. CH37]CUU58196.1 Transcriptional regulatory protein, C terminal [Parafrankia irregularis]
MRFGVLGPTTATTATATAGDGDGDGSPLELGPRRRRELITLLLLRPGVTVTADALADELWQGEPPPAARSTLQAHLSVLRRVLEPGASPPYRLLVTRGSGYALAVSPADLDTGRLDELRALARRALDDGDPVGARAHLERALALWRGEPFADLADHPAAEAARVKLAEDRMAVRADLLSVRLDLGEHDAVIGELRVLTSQHPLQERLHAQLATALYRGGRQADALTVIRQARQTLADDLGLEPGPELRELETAILRHDAGLGRPGVPHVGVPRTGVLATPALTAPTLATPATAGAAGAAGGRLPLLGRDRELAVLEQAWERTATEQATGVALLSGEAGIGKTRLLEELARRVPAQTRWGRCTQVSGAPAYWPWRQLLRGLPAEVVGAFGAVRDGDGPVRFEVALAIGRHLAELASAGPVLALLEDLHWADPASIAMLEILAGELTDVPVLLVCSFRPGHGGTAAPGDPAGGGQDGEPLRRLLGVLARHPALTRVELAGLPPTDVGRLFGAVSGMAPTPVQAEAVRRRTAGNPFFVVELARLAATTSAGRATTAGQATADGLATAVDQAAAAGTLPTGVRDTVLARLAAMPAGLTRLLAAAAVVGREAALPVVTAAAGLSQAGALDAVDIAVAAGLADVPAPGRLRFTHDIVREAVLVGMGTAERARLAGLVADALVAHQGASVPAAVLAHHLRVAAAGHPDLRAAQAQAAAARAALAQFAFEDAASLAGHGLDLVPGDRPDLRVDLMVIRGEALRRSAAFAQAQQVLTEAAGIATAHGDTVRAGLATLTRAGDAVGGYSSLFHVPVPGLIADLDAAAAALPAAEGDLRLRLLTSAAVRACYGEPAAASRLIGRAAEVLAEQRTTRPGAAEEPAGLLIARALAAWTPAHTGLRLAIADTLLATVEGPPSGELVARHLRRAVLWELGEVEAAEGESAAFNRRLRQVRDPDFDLLDRCWQAMHHLYAGRYDQAAEVAAILGGPLPGVTPGAINALTQSANTIHGITAWDRATLGDFLPQVDDMEEQVIAEWALIRALALVDTGRPEAAAREVRRLVRPDLADVAPGAMEPVYVVLLAEIVAQLVDAVPDMAEWATGLADRIAGYGETLVTFVLGLTCMGPATLYRGGLALALGRVDEAIADLRSSLVLADRTGGVPFVIRTRRRLAQALGRAGHADEARQLDRAAARDAHTIGMRLPYSGTPVPDSGT